VGLRVERGELGSVGYHVAATETEPIERNTDVERNPEEPEQPEAPDDERE